MEGAAAQSDQLAECGGKSGSVKKTAIDDGLAPQWAPRAWKYDCEALRKMWRGEAYMPFEAKIEQAIRDSKVHLYEFNNTYSRLFDAEGARQSLLKLLGDVGERTFIDAPFQCDLGFNVFVGSDTFINRGAVFLDQRPIRIGNFTKLGPEVHIYTVYHPVERAPGVPCTEKAEPVTIGNDCWVGGKAIILPGVTIGNGSTIGAGSIVTRDVPPHCVYAGNPARFLRKVVPQEAQDENQQ